MDRRAAVELVRRFAEAFNAAAGDDLAALRAVATPTVFAGFLVESHAGVVAPLASRISVPAGARLEVDRERVTVLDAGMVVAAFTGHGFARDDFRGDAELQLDGGRVARVLFRAP